MPELIPGLTDDEKESFNLGEENEEEEFSEDFTGTDGHRPIIEIGMHTAKCIDFERGVSKKGKPQYISEFIVTSGPSKGMKRKYYTPLTGVMRWKAVQLLEAMGVKASGVALRFKKSDIVGKPCMIDVDHQEYNGEPTDNIKSVYEPTGEAILACQDQPNL